MYQSLCSALNSWPHLIPDHPMKLVWLPSHIRGNWGLDVWWPVPLQPAGGRTKPGLRFGGPLSQSPQEDLQSQSTTAHSSEKNYQPGKQDLRPARGPLCHASVFHLVTMLWPHQGWRMDRCRRGGQASWSACSLLQSQVLIVAFIISP